MKDLKVKALACDSLEDTIDTKGKGKKGHNV